MPDAVRASKCFLFFSHLFLVTTPSVGPMGVGFLHFTEDETGTEIKLHARDHPATT